METHKFSTLIIFNILVALLILPQLAYVFLAIVMVNNYCGSTFVVFFTFFMGTTLAKMSVQRSLANTLLTLTSLIFFQLFIIELVIIKFKTIAKFEEEMEKSNHFVLMWKLVGVVDSEGAMKF